MDGTGKRVTAVGRRMCGCGRGYVLDERHAPYCSACDLEPYGFAWEQQRAARLGMRWSLEDGIH